MHIFGLREAKSTTAGKRTPENVKLLLPHRQSRWISQRISFQSPWQNGVAERWVGSCRIDLLDQVVVLNEVHLRRLIRDYISYYHEDRIHDSLEKDTPAMRPVASKPNQSARLLSFPRIGGLHHRYDWHEAA